MRAISRITGVALAITALVACSSPNAPTGDPTATTTSSTSAPATTSEARDPTPSTTSSGGELEAADDVAEAFAAAAVTWDTTIDSTETSALIRAKKLVTPELAATFVEPVAGSGAAFNEAAAKNATSEPTIMQTSTAYQPPDTETDVYRAYTATWTWTGSDGTSWQDPRTRTMYLTVTKQPDGSWLVSTYDYQDQQS